MDKGNEEAPASLPARFCRQRWANAMGLGPPFRCRRIGCTLYAAIHMVREGTLDLMPEGWGFLRNTVGELYNQDVYVSRTLIERFCLKPGDTVRGEVRQPRDSEKFYGLLCVKSVHGRAPGDAS